MSPRRPTPTASKTPPVPRSQRSPGDAVFRRVAENRRARHEYDILEVFECGIELKGGEVKSLRAGQVSLQDSYARIDDGELWLLGTCIVPYEYSSGFGAIDPERKRKLLLHRHQIDELNGRVAQQSLTLVPLSMYFKDGHAKLELALGRGRRLYDKRRALAEKEANRDAERQLRGAERFSSAQNARQD